MALRNNTVHVLRRIQVQRIRQDTSTPQHPFRKHPSHRHPPSAVPMSRVQSLKGSSRVGVVILELPENTPGKVFVDLAMPSDGLLDPSSRILIPVALAALPDEWTTAVLPVDVSRCCHIAIVAPRKVEAPRTRPGVGVTRSVSPSCADTIRVFLGVLCG